jgi:hypothetical protein
LEYRHSDVNGMMTASDSDGERPLHAEDGLTEERSVSWPRQPGDNHACQMGGGSLTALVQAEARMNQCKESRVGKQPVAAYHSN